MSKIKFKKSIVVIILLSIFVLVGFFAIQNRQKTKKITTPQTLINQKPISILMLGVDQGIEGRHDRGNSDTMILVTLNPKKGNTTVTSIPRDLLAQIEKNDKKFWFKINSAYQVGGSKTAVKTVSSLLNVPIDYYMEVNMKTVKNLVDELGGVDIEVPFSFIYHTKFKKGKMHLTGKQALDYSRMRYDDPKGDYGRQMRQRQIIFGVVKKLLNITAVSHYQKVAQIINKEVKTNFPMDKIVGVGLKYKSAVNKIEDGYIHAHDAWIDKAAMQVASTAELQRVSNKIRKNMDLEEESLVNAETQLNLEQDVNWNSSAAFKNYHVKLLD